MPATLTCGASSGIATALLVNVILLTVRKKVIFVYSDGTTQSLTVLTDVNEAIAALPLLNQVAITSLPL